MMTPEAKRLQEQLLRGEEIKVDAKYKLFHNVPRKPRHVCEEQVRAIDLGRNK